MKWLIGVTTTFGLLIFLWQLSLNKSESLANNRQPELKPSLLSGAPAAAPELKRAPPQPVTLQPDTLEYSAFEDLITLLTLVNLPAQVPQLIEAKDLVGAAAVLNNHLYNPNALLGLEYIQSTCEFNSEDQMSFAQQTTERINDLAESPNYPKAELTEISENIQAEYNALNQACDSLNAYDYIDRKAIKARINSTSSAATHTMFELLYNSEIENDERRKLLDDFPDKENNTVINNFYAYSLLNDPDKENIERGIEILINSELPLTVTYSPIAHCLQEGCSHLISKYGTAEQWLTQAASTADPQANQAIVDYYQNKNDPVNATAWRLFREKIFDRKCVNNAQQVLDHYLNEKPSIAQTLIGMPQEQQQASHKKAQQLFDQHIKKFKTSGACG